MKTPHQLARTNPKNDAAVAALEAHIIAGFAARLAAANAPAARAAKHTADARERNREREHGARS